MTRRPRVGSPRWHLRWPRVFRGPHTATTSSTAFVLVCVLHPRSRTHGSHAPRSAPRLCAGASASARRGSNNRPPSARRHIRTHGHALRRWSCPRRPAGTPAPPVSAVPLRRAVHGRSARPWNPQAGLHGPLPNPGTATAAGSSSQLPGPSPTSPPPGSQRHVTTGAAEGQSPARAAAAGGGACRGASREARPGEQGRPLTPNGFLAAESVTKVTTRREFPLQVPAQVSRPFVVPTGDLVAGPWSLGLIGLGGFIKGLEPGGRLQRGRLPPSERHAPGPFPGRASLLLLGGCARLWPRHPKQLCTSKPALEGA